VPLSRDEAQAHYLESSLSQRWVIPRLVDAVIAGAKGEGSAWRDNHLRAVANGLE
jgi:hypothetical protein